MKARELKELVNLMLIRQEEQSGKRDIKVFRRSPTIYASEGGFDWEKTKEGFTWWREKIRTHLGVRMPLIRMIARCPPEGFDLSPKAKRFTINNQEYVV